MNRRLNVQERVEMYHNDSVIITYQSILAHLILKANPRYLLKFDDGCPRISFFDYAEPHQTLINDVQQHLKNYVKEKYSDLFE